MAERQTVPLDVLDGERFDAVSKMLDRIAHDLGNLLMPLTEYPVFLRRELPEGGIGLGLLDGMDKSACDLQHLSAQIAALAATARVRQEVVDVGLAVDEALMRVVAEAGARQVRLVPVVPEGLWRAHGCSDDLCRALENLYRNAIEASADGGTVDIEAVNVRTDGLVTSWGDRVPAGAYVCVGVVDHGAGIDPNVAGNLLCPFVTTKKASTRRGAGLGLSIVYRVARAHRGTVDHGTAAGKGAAFRLYLKAHEA